VKNRTLALLLCWGSLAGAATYEVGPGKPYATVGAVPWESLQPGDLVLIHARSTPYKEKFVLCRQGTAEQPIVVKGVRGSDGALPVLDGNGATTRAALNYWNQARGVVKIGGANVPADTMPRHIVVENLEIRSARPPYTFTPSSGAAQTYSANAAAIYVEKGEHVTIRNCVLRDSGNGLFIGSPADQPSRDFLIEGNSIYDNGNDGSAYEHNNYSAAIGIVFQYNRFGPPRAGSVGNNLKDRSAGLVVRYNWIEGGNRQLDLVDAEDSSIIEADPSYRSTFVYGNVLIEPAGAGNRQMAHYGGDSGNTAGYRKGTLHFYNNTLISTRTDRTTLFRLSTNEETCDFRNNIAYVTAAGSTLAMLDQDGQLMMSHNWFKPGRVSTFGTLLGMISDDGTSVTGTSPGFHDEANADYRLAAGAAAIDSGALMNPAVPAAHEPLWQYLKHQGGEARLAAGALDLGAFEYSALPRSRCDLNGDGSVNVIDLQRLVNLALGIIAGPPEFGDLNRSGSVDVLDVQLLVNVILGTGGCPA
jgi:hypothetical protein